MQSSLSICRKANIAIYEGAKNNLPDADRYLTPLARYLAGSGTFSLFDSMVHWQNR
jgi:hypothetical protein